MALSGGAEQLAELPLHRLLSPMESKSQLRVREVALEETQTLLPAEGMKKPLRD